MDVRSHVLTVPAVRRRGRTPQVRDLRAERGVHRVGDARDPGFGVEVAGETVRDDDEHETAVGVGEAARRRHPPVPEGPAPGIARERHLYAESPRDLRTEGRVLDAPTVHGGHRLDRAGLQDRAAHAEQRLVEAPEVVRGTAHAAAGLHLGDVPRLVVQLVDAVRNHLQRAVDETGHAVPGPVHRHDAIAVVLLAFERDPEVAVVESERRGDLVAQVAIDAPSVDPLDDRSEDPPAARCVVAGLRARRPHRRRGRGGGDRRLPGDVGVVRRVSRHREPARVGEHVADAWCAPCRWRTRRCSRRRGRRGRGDPAPRAGAPRRSSRASRRSTRA